jgi:hypothetical protein
MRFKSVAVLTVAVVAAFAAPSMARADAVTDWNLIASNSIVATAGQPPAVASLSYAIVQGAVYDAVNSIDQVAYQPYLGTVPANPWDSKEAAVAAAAHDTLAWMFPAQAGPLQTAYDNYLAALADNPAGSKAAGKAVGQAAAAAMIAARTGDGRFGPGPALLPEAPGVWRPVPPSPAADPAPWIGNVKPFLVPDAEMLRTKGPNALTSRAYTKDYNEVKSVGSRTSTTRTADQTEAAIWWQANGAFWNSVMRGISSREGVGIVDNARLFAMFNLAGADGFIGCYNDKYYWQFWRPISAIRAGDSDGNPDTVGDPTWTPLFDPATAQQPGAAPLFTPPFPDHPSAHNCSSSALVHAVQDFFNTDKLPFSAFSPRTGTTRSFERLSDALDEVINARVWGGIHFRTADEQGAKLGREVAQYEHVHYFRATH